MKSYRDLDIYEESLDLFYRTPPLSLKLPKYELFELGSQLRRAADSVVSNIVEGYGRKKYKSAFIRFLIIAHASGLETLCPIEKWSHLYPEFQQEFHDLFLHYDRLNAKIYKFISYVKKNWKT